MTKKYCDTATLTNYKKFYIDKSSAAYFRNINVPVLLYFTTVNDDAYPQPG